MPVAVLVRRKNSYWKRFGGPCGRSSSASVGARYVDSSSFVFPFFIVSNLENGDVAHGFDDNLCLSSMIAFVTYSVRSTIAIGRTCTVGILSVRS